MTATSPAPAVLPIQCASAQPDPGQRPEGDSIWKRIALWFLCFGIVCGVVLFFVTMGWVYWSGQDEIKQPRYHVAVDAVTGLDPDTELQRSAPLAPEFNLTVGLAPRSVTTGWCFHGGSTVRVSYRDVQLATGALPRLCVGPRQSGEKGSVVAWGKAVDVPRMVRDALASVLRRGGAEFEVALTVAMAPHAISWVVVSCMAQVSRSAVPHATDVGPVSYGRSAPVMCG